MNILFDCGEGTSQQLLKYGFAKDEIDSIIISHMHCDHVSGLYLVLQMFYLNKRKADLNIYLPESLREFTESMKLFYLFPERFDYKINFKEMNELDLKWIEPMANDHLSSYTDYITKNKIENKMRSFSFKISEENCKIVYSSDLKTTSFLENKLSDVDLLIIDSQHPTYDQLDKIMRNKKLKFIINHGMSESMKKLISELPENKYELADEELEITL